MGPLTIVRSQPDSATAVRSGKTTSKPLHANRAEGVVGPPAAEGVLVGPPASNSLTEFRLPGFAPSAKMAS
jgi:hypothetical protein